MFQFIGYDFFGGPNVLRSAPSEVKNITSAKLTNAIYDHFNITKDIHEYGNIIKPNWSYDTILNADFNGNINAGGLKYTLEQISEIRIKRRVKGTFDWTELKRYQINTIEDINIVYKDFLNKYGVEYEYAIVPVIEGAEGEYIIGNILSKFSGVFIGDSEQAFRMMYDVNYSNNVRNQQIGVFSPLGRKYPIVIGNGILNYDSGSVSAMLLNDEFDTTGEIDRDKLIKKKEEFKNYLSDKKPKILKDWNGNFWLVMITGNISIGYKEGSGMSVPQVQFDWTEIDDADDLNTLQEVYYNKNNLD